MSASNRDSSAVVFPGRTLIAGVGNVFLGDDGFGVAVAHRLLGQSLPPEVKVVDFGIRGLHLAYELLDGGYETTILVDATPRGGAPGTIYLIEPELAAETAGAGTAGAGTVRAETVLVEAAGGSPSPASAGEAFSAHGMTPDAVFHLLALLGGRPSPRVLLVGCEPASTEDEIGLSEPVARSVEEAVRLILDLVPGKSTEGVARAESAT